MVTHNDILRSIVNYQNQSTCLTKIPQYEILWPFGVETSCDPLWPIIAHQAPLWPIVNHPLDSQRPPNVTTCGRLLLSLSWHIVTFCDTLRLVVTFYGYVFLRPMTHCDMLCHAQQDEVESHLHEMSLGLWIRDLNHESMPNLITIKIFVLRNISMMV